MPLTVIFVCGPAQSRKSAVAQLITREILPRPAHYLRLLPTAPSQMANGGAQLRLVDENDVWEGLASAQRVPYAPDRVFEILPETFRAIKKKQRFGTVVIEADADPCLRHAYPYDSRIFVMRAPRGPQDIFRRPDEASVALQQVMEDTAAFASEIFGLFEDANWDDDEGIRHRRHPQTSRGIDEELEVSDVQVRRFLSSPLGGEIAARIQLRPMYHAVVESDIVLVNRDEGTNGAVLDECLCRLTLLLSRIHGAARRDRTLFCCDPTQADDPERMRFVDQLRTLLLE